jgi:hypothetical protein
VDYLEVGLVCPGQGKNLGPNDEKYLESRRTHQRNLDAGHLAFLRLFEGHALQQSAERRPNDICLCPLVRRYTRRVVDLAVSS